MALHITPPKPAPLFHAPGVHTHITPPRPMTLRELLQRRSALGAARKKAIAKKR